jgi:biopolymer transport protein ExbB/TolQ
VRAFAILLMVTGFLGGALYTVVAIAVALRHAAAAQAGTTSDNIAGGASISLGWPAIGLLVGVVGVVLFMVARRRPTRVL